MGKLTRGNNAGFRARPDLKLALKLRDGFRCLYCNANLEGESPQNITIDHLKPFSKGGSNEPKNCITACRSCNCTRQAISWRAFARQVGGIEAVTRIIRHTSRKITKYRIRAKISTRPIKE